MTLLLIVIYVAFIGLGVPDSLIGSAWPAIYPDLNLPVDSVSIITLIISGCTVVSSIFSAKILSILGTAKVTAVSTAMTALALLGFSFAPNILWMIPLAVVLGLGAGAIDSGLNNYIALHFKAKHMNFLHGFYGIGVTLSPYLVSLALSKTTWRVGYRYAAVVQGIIAVIVIASIPLWKRKSSSDEEEVKPKSLSLFEMIKVRGLVVAWIIMLATNAIEYACGVWGGTYLVNSRGFSAEDGAAALSLYYAGMALGRLLSGILSGKIKTWSRIWIGAAIVGFAAVLISLPLPSAISVIALALMGFGNGSIYPNFIHLTPHNFGKETSQSVMGSLIAFAYIGVMLSPPLVGLVTGVLSISAYPFILMSLFVIMIFAISFFKVLLKKQGKYNKEI
ncbi:MAG: MFS transporter [Clostridia bacterium]|nr:MFS transporter [Clostridia bacterium]